MHLIKSKFEEAFDKFDIIVDTDHIKKEIDSILERHYEQNLTQKSIRLIRNCIDLTLLTATDNEDKIFDLIRSVNEAGENDPTLPPVAAICVYPNFVGFVKENLTTEDVAVACVSGGFPSSQTFLDVKIVETGLAINQGADEVDIVLHIGNFLSGHYQEVSDEIMELRDVTKDKKLKVILETGALKTPENIQRAAILALFCGADFIKTSTGKEYPGASLEAVYLMAHVIRQYHALFKEQRGLKVSGGVRTTEDAVKYLSIVHGVLGEEWLTNKLFRIGASSLIEDLSLHMKQ